MEREIVIVDKIPSGLVIIKGNIMFIGSDENTVGKGEDK